MKRITVALIAVVTLLFLIAVIFLLQSHLISEKTCIILFTSLVFASLGFLMKHGLENSDFIKHLK